MQADASGGRRAIEGRRHRVAGTSIVNEISLNLNMKRNCVEQSYFTSLKWKLLRTRRISHTSV